MISQADNKKKFEDFRISFHKGGTCYQLFDVITTQKPWTDTQPL